MRYRTSLLVALLLMVAACSRGTASTDPDEVLFIVSAPVTPTSWLANFTSRGAFIAAEELNDAGGIDVGGRKRKVRVEVMDNAGSPATAADVAREAVRRGAAALITDGSDAAAVAEVTGPAKLPTFVVWEGGDDIVGPDKPSIFRMAPANRAMAARLAGYLSGQRPKVAVIHDDSSYGRAGTSALDVAFQRNQVEVVTTLEVPQAGTGVEPAVARARSAGATLLVVWARAPVVAVTLRAARESGWPVPVYTGPSGEDPLVRERLWLRPEWVDGLTFVSFRITAETGPEPFERFRAAYERKYRPDRTIRDKDDKLVITPPDWAIHSYDSVLLVAAALKRSGGALGGPLLQQLNQVSLTGANGEERGFTEANHEAVSPDDLYLARVDNMRFYPVQDDSLSRGLPPVPQ